MKTHIMEVVKHFPIGISKGNFLKAKDIILLHSRWMVGDGEDNDFLHDTWIGDRPLIHFLNPPISDVY